MCPFEFCTCVLTVSSPWQCNALTKLCFLPSSHFECCNYLQHMTPMDVDNWHSQREFSNKLHLKITKPETSPTIKLYTIKGPEPDLSDIQYKYWVFDSNCLFFFTTTTSCIKLLIIFPSVTSFSTGTATPLSVVLMVSLSTTMNRAEPTLISLVTSTLLNGTQSVNYYALCQ